MRGRLELGLISSGEMRGKTTVQPDNLSSSSRQPARGLSDDNSLKTNTKTSDDNSLKTNTKNTKW